MALNSPSTRQGVVGEGYLPHVDGLRAVAVLMVVFFHYGFGFSGGYAGVDVFFVLSGFLITRLILRDLEMGSFRLAEFWCRRARRILPALMLVLSVTLVAGWFLLFPADFASMGEALLAQSVFLQNVVFWRGEGYFALPSESKPLLHTWSLAVEEQFYLVYPLLVLVLFRAGRHRQFPAALGILCLASFALGVAGIKYFPSASFYFLPTRAWELLVGGLVTFLPPCSAGIKAREFLSALSLLLVLASGVIFSPETPFPGYYAALPVLATAGFLWINLGTPSWVAQRLSWKPLVFVGLISYSLYLWHWPVLVFARMWAPGPLTVEFRIGLALLVVAFASLSWKFIEQPARKGFYFRPPGRVALFSAFSLVFCAIAGFTIISNNGIPSRLPENLLASIEAASERYFVNEHKADDIRNRNLTSFGAAGKSPSIFIWGDSLAMALIAGFDELLSEAGLAGRAATHSSTPPLLDFQTDLFYSLKQDAPEFASEVINLIREESPSDVVLIAAWSGYFEMADDPRQMKESLNATIRELIDAGSFVWIVLEPPRHRDHIPMILARNNRFSIDPSPQLVSLEEHRARIETVLPLFQNLPGDRVKIVDLTPRFMSSDQTFLIEIDGEPLYRDHVHLSLRGAVHAVGALKEAGFPSETKKISPSQIE